LKIDQSKVLRMKFGILSTAKIARKVSKAIHGSKNGKLIAVASRNLEKAKQFASENNIPKYYGTYDELLQDKEVEAIYVPLPTTLATEWCIKIANSGKHVL
jgi:predicted dehydrogenase